MQHGHQPLPSQQLSTPASQQQLEPTHHTPPHTNSRPSIPSLLHNHYPLYPAHPVNDTMLYMHTPPPPHPQYYPYHPPPSAPAAQNPDHLHQHPQPTNTILPPAPPDPVAYSDTHHRLQTFPADQVAHQVSSVRPHLFGNDTAYDPMPSLPSNLSIPGNTPKLLDNSRPLSNLPPLRSAPSHPTDQSLYASPQRMQNMNTMMPRSTLSTVPYHPSIYMPPSIPPQNLHQVADTPPFYNNPYHDNMRNCFPPEQRYQRTPVHNLQWQTHLAPATPARSTTDARDDRRGFPPYYVGPDGVTRYFGQQVAPRKKRLQWTPELHAKFVKAVEEFGVETAVPKLLLQAMNVPGLTRENVASHLQKYRESMRKKKLELERAKSGMKMVSKEHDEKAKAMSGCEAIDEVVDGARLEVEADKDKGFSERVIMTEKPDSTKRLRNMEWEASETIDNKRRKGVSSTQESEGVEGTELTEQEVESYARVRARVDEALQLQTSRRQERRDPDVI